MPTLPLLRCSLMLTAHRSSRPTASFLVGSLLPALIPHTPFSLFLPSARLSVCPSFPAGYPNVGKSSLINSLKRSKAVSVSSVPGHTRSLQEVSIDSKISLIDCPGVIFDDSGAGADDVGGFGGTGGDASAAAAGGSDAGAGLLLRNCVRVEDIADPEGAVTSILRRCAPEKLMALYAIPVFADANEFLAHMAGKRGKLGKGGVPDKAGAARSVLQDWNSGRIPFYVLPPTMGSGSSSGSTGAGAGAAGAGMDEDAGAGAAASAGSAKGGKKGGKAASSAAATGGAGAAAAAPRTSTLVDEADVDDAAIVSGWSKVSRLLGLLHVFHSRWCACSPACVSACDVCTI